jgi:exonuclease SbcC
MATTPSMQTDLSIDSTKDIQKPEDRVLAISKIPADTPDAQAKFSSIAQNDTDESVRCAAIRRLLSLDDLYGLRKTPGLIKSTATQQLLEILAGKILSNYEETERIEKIRELSPAENKQIGLLAKCKAAGNEALSIINEAEDLADLCLFSISVHVRKNAAIKINDTKLLKMLREKVRNKDKTVFKILDQRLGSEANKEITSITEQSQQSFEATEKLALKTEPELGPKQLKESQPSALFTKNPNDGAAHSSKSKDKKSATTKSSAAKPPKEKVKEEKLNLNLAELELESKKLSHKNTTKLNALSNAFDRHKKIKVYSEENADERLSVLEISLKEKSKKNKLHQEQLQISTTSLFEVLKKALNEGQSQEALPTWDKIQGNISNTSGKIHSELQGSSNVYKDKLNELRDWKTFAATEKKKELIEHMQHLIDSKMHAADISRHINKMHSAWKSLGRSNQNESLWKQFKQLSDQAYEPCKQYFKQRKLLMVENLTNRREICGRLENEIKKIAIEAVNISALNKLLNSSDLEWKKYAPIEQSKIKTLQKRYYAVVNQFRKIRKNAFWNNGNKKREFINQAKALIILEDRQKAMIEAKNLQQEWKKLSPASFKEDQKYWEDFRSACDKIFEKRNQESNEQKHKLEEIEEKLNQSLKSLGKLFSLNEDDFRKARSDYQEIAQEFTTSLSPQLKNSRSRFLDQFNGLKRKIDSRFKNLPDKKRQLLIGSLTSKSNFLKEIESKLQVAIDESEFITRKNSINVEIWNQLESCKASEYEDALQSRLDKVLNTKNQSDFQNLLVECEDKVRALCIELEIRADIDTPKDDQALRMQIQLDQLKNGFGKMKPDNKQNTRYAQEAELKIYCLGPLKESAETELAQRSSGAIRKLLIY